MLLIVSVVIAIPIIGKNKYFSERYCKDIEYKESMRYQEKESIDSISGIKGEMMCAFIADDFSKKINGKYENDSTMKELTRLVAFCLRKKGDDDIDSFIRINRILRDDFSGSKKDREKIGYKITLAVFPGLKTNQDGVGLFGIQFNGNGRIEYSDVYDIFSDYVEKKYDNRYGKSYQ